MPVNFPYFHLLHTVMGGRAAVTPVHLLDSPSPEVGELQLPTTSGPTLTHRQRRPILLRDSDRKMQLLDCISFLLVRCLIILRCQSHTIDASPKQQKITIVAAAAILHFINTQVSLVIVYLNTFRYAIINHNNLAARVNAIQSIRIRIRITCAGVKRGVCTAIGWLCWGSPLSGPCLTEKEGTLFLQH